ncbi:MAG: DUF4352 domain-containing protein [Desulfobacterales bacterium]|nr:DUF4352 domain-containing protein [Desulfobacterales bacterium]
MKTRRTVIILFTLFLSGCLQSTLNLPPDKGKLERIEAGTLENSVRIIAGQPDRIVESRCGYQTYYYREKLASDCTKELQTCIPIVIEKGKVAAVGRQWAKAWVQQRNKKVAFEPKDEHQATTADQETTQQKIARLEKQVKTIPMSRTVDNLNIYRYLLKLDPANKRYKTKVAYYKKQFVKEKALRVAAKKQAAATRKWQNARLKEFKGNPPAQMALEILGNGKFYVWLKNIGNKPFRVEARQFFLSCEKNKRYTIYRSKDFGKEVQPGKIIEGRVTFATSCAPREFIYLNPGIASVPRRIPVPETKARGVSPGNPISNESPK